MTDQTNVGGYILGDVLGAGSFGQVHKGLNITTGQFAAIKIMNAQSIKMSQIQLEIDILRKVDHPNIIKYLDCSPAEYKGKPYIIFEFIENGSLKDIIKKFGLFSEDLAKRYMLQILKGLNYLHTQDILHRDIKAANILINKEGQCKLADFGVAAEISSDNMTVSAVGTLAWMAPELFGVGDISSASDIWSIGCLIVELLSGSPPYHGLSQMQVLYNLLEVSSLPPLPSGLSSSLVDLLTRCFQHNPNDRPTAAELMEHAWFSGTLQKPKSELRLQEDLQELQKSRRRRQAVFERPKEIDDIIAKSLPFRPEAIPMNSGISRSVKKPSIPSLPLLKKFSSCSEMEPILRQQLITSYGNIVSSDIKENIKDDYKITLAVAQQYKEEYDAKTREFEKLTKQRDKFMKQYLSLKANNSLLNSRQQVLEPLFTGKELAAMYYDVSDINSLPQEALKGVLMIKNNKGQWKKRAVALLERFFFIYEIEKEEEPLHVYKVVSPTVLPLSKETSGFDYCFSISTPEGCLETGMTMRAANIDIMQKWIAGFLAVQNEEAPVPQNKPPGLKSSILSPRSSGKHSVISRSISSSILETPRKPKFISRKSSTTLSKMFSEEQLSTVAQKLSSTTQNISTILTTISRECPSEDINEAKRQLTQLKHIEAVLMGLSPVESLTKTQLSTEDYKAKARDAYLKQT